MNRRIQPAAGGSRPGLGLIVPMLLLVVGLGAATWGLGDWLVLRNAVNEGRTVADIADNIGKWASQYGGVHVRTVGTQARIPGNFLTRSMYAMSDADGQVLQGARVDGAVAERSALERVEAYHWKNPALVQREVADVISASGSKSRYRLTARTVLNKNNAPDAFEREALDALQAAAERRADAADAQEYWRVVGSRLLYARALVAQPSCLRCHDSPDKAPEFIRTNAQFNGGGGYGYVAGKPAALISVSVPLAGLEATALRSLPPAVWAALGTALVGALWMLLVALRRRP